MKIKNVNWRRVNFWTAYFIYITSLLVIAFSYYYYIRINPSFFHPPTGRMFGWFYLPGWGQHFSHIDFFEHVFRTEKPISKYITVASISWEPDNYYNWDPSKIISGYRTWYPEDHAPDLADPQKQKSENRPVVAKITPPEVFIHLHFANKKLEEVSADDLQQIFFWADQVVSPTSHCCGLFIMLSEKDNVTIEKFLFHLLSARLNAVVRGKHPVKAIELAINVDRDNLFKYLKPEMSNMRKVNCPKEFRVTA